MENKNATAAKKASLVREVTKVQGLALLQLYSHSMQKNLYTFNVADILYNGVAQNKILLPTILHALIRFKHCSSKVTFLEKRRLLFLYKIVST